MTTPSLEQRAEAFLEVAERALETPLTLFPIAKHGDDKFQFDVRNDAPALVTDLLAEVRRLREQQPPDPRLQLGEPPS